MEMGIRLRDWREVINEDLPQIEITDSTVKRAKEYGLAVRKFYDPADYEARRQRVLSRPLP